MRREQFQVYLDDRQRERLAELSARLRVSRSLLIREAIDRYLGAVAAGVSPLPEADW